MALHAVANDVVEAPVAVFWAKRSSGGMKDTKLAGYRADLVVVGVFLQLPHGSYGFLHRPVGKQEPFRRCHTRRCVAAHPQPRYRRASQALVKVLSDQGEHDMTRRQSAYISQYNEYTHSTSTSTFNVQRSTQHVSICRWSESSIS